MNRFEFLRQLALAKAGNAEAMFTVANCYYNGDGVERSYEKEIEWLKKAADKGHAVANSNLAYYYKKGLGVPKSMSKAAEYYQKAGELGDTGSFRYAAEIHYNGDGVPPSHETALRILIRASEKGNSSAMLEVGDMYRYGVGTGQSYPTALKYYEMASKKYLPANERIGDLYRFGLGVQQSYETAAQHYEKTKTACSLCELGWMYEHGLFFEKDVSKAIELYTESTESTVQSPASFTIKYHGRGFANLGRLKEYGDGSTIEDAIDMYEKGIENGCPCSPVYLSIIYSDGIRTERSQDKVDLYVARMEGCDTLSILKEGSGIGRADDRYLLGWLYETGTLVDKDLEKAEELYRLSAEQGFVPAKLRLDRIFGNTAPVKQQTTAIPMTDGKRRDILVTIAARLGGDVFSNTGMLSGLLGDFRMEKGDAFLVLTILRNEKLKISELTDDRMIDWWSEKISSETYIPRDTIHAVICDIIYAIQSNEND